MSDLHVNAWGNGTPVVLVHGSLATGADEWAMQQPLAGEGLHLLVPDRRGYRNSPAERGEDFLRDADDIAELLGDGAHIVGHSYGALGAMFAAARRPEATLSLALLEPPVVTVAANDATVRAMEQQLRNVFDTDVPDHEWLALFLEAVGTDLTTLPAQILDEIVPLVPIVRRGRRPWDIEPPLAALASATFPKVVISGGHSAAFDAICDMLAERIDADRAEVQGAGHEIQLTGPKLNQTLVNMWRD